MMHSDKLQHINPTLLEGIGVDYAHVLITITKLYPPTTTTGNSPPQPATISELSLA